MYGHTGFMLALEKLNIQISASSGCSAGVVVSGIIASGTNIQDWAEAATHVSKAVLDAAFIVTTTLPVTGRYSIPQTMVILWVSA